MWWLVRCLRWRNGLVDRCVLRVFTCHCSLIFKLQVSVLLFFSLLAPRATRSFHVFLSFPFTILYRCAHTLRCHPPFFPLLVPLLLLLLLSFAFCAYLHPPSCCVSGYTQLQSSTPTQFEHMLGVCAS